jgi:hypothetical protein
MKNIVKWFMLGVIVITAILTYICLHIAHKIEVIQPSHDDLATYQFNLDMFKTILAGFLVAMLGILIPASIAETKNNFIRLKESRIAYSKAKTGIDYLSLYLCTAKLTDAEKFIRVVHFYKHQAVLFPEFKQHIKERFGDNISPDDWDEVVYRKLRNTRILLKRNATIWDKLSPAKRLEILRFALPDIDEVETNSHLKEYKLSLKDDETPNCP